MLEASPITGKRPGTITIEKAFPRERQPEPIVCDRHDAPPVTPRDLCVAPSTNAARTWHSLPHRRPEGSPLWPRTRYPSRVTAQIYDPALKTKKVWIDRGMAYCHLCREPVSNMQSHSGWWDHVNLHLYFRLWCAQPRRWAAKDVLWRAKARFPHLFHVCAPPTQVTCSSSSGSDGPSSSRYVSASDFLDVLYNGSSSTALSSRSLLAVAPFERDDVLRRAELTALLRAQCVAPISSLRMAFSGAYDAGAAGQGEKMFRGTLSRVATILLPPMSPETHTRMQQKCWGRQTLEMAYTFLGIGKIQLELFSVPPKVDKNARGLVMRQLFFELHLLQTDARATELQRYLAELTLQRLAVELIVTRTGLYMGTARSVVEFFGTPTLESVEDSGFNFA